MKMKRSAALVLALALTAAMAAPAFAAEIPEGWTPADGARIPEGWVPADGARVAEEVDVPLGDSYKTQLVLNGEDLDTAAIPAVAPKMLPMRLLAETDGGYAEWYPEDNQGYFFFADSSITVSFADNSVELNNEKVEGVTAIVTEGVTFLPAEFVGTLEGVEVDLNMELDVDRVDVATPNGTPIMKLVNAIKDTCGMGMGMKSSPAEMEEVYGEALNFKAEYMTEGVIILPMMTSPDTVILGKVAEGKTEDLKAALEAYRQTQENTFTWYLSHNLPKTQDAKFVTSGDWFLFLIGENADEAVAVFEAGVATLDADAAE